jgi:nucleoid DNA-binding protein
MNKSDLVGEIAGTTGYTRAEASRVVDLVFGGVAGALTRGEEVSISGFGIFRCKERSAKRGRNPRTGEPIQIAAKRSASLRPGKALREAINQPSGAEALAAELGISRRRVG